MVPLHNFGFPSPPPMTALFFTSLVPSLVFSSTPLLFLSFSNSHHYSISKSVVLQSIYLTAKLQLYLWGCFRRVHFGKAN